MAEKKPSFIMYDSFAMPLSLMSMEERGIFITAIYEYRISGTVSINMSAGVAMAFAFVKDALDRDTEAYEKRCEENSKNGKKGGRPRKNSCEQNQTVFLKTKKADNDNGNGNDNDNDNDNDNGGGNENENENENVNDNDNGGGSDNDNINASFCAPHTIPPQEKQEDKLLKAGIPREYWEPRLERARSFTRRGKDSADVLIEWYKEDKGKERRTQAQSPPSVSRVSAGKADELNEWFAERLDRVLTG